jgi:hypothetical protein
VSTFVELNVRSAVAVDAAFGVIDVGDAVIFKTRLGVNVTNADTLFGVPAHPAPPVPGP